MPLRANMRHLLVAALCTLLATNAARAHAEGVAGAYLAARHASISSDYENAAQFYVQALVRDPSNPILMENAMSALVGLGQTNRAVPLARRLMQDQVNSQVGNLVLLANDVAQDRFEQVLENLDAGQSVGPLFDDLLRAWSLVGLGRMSDALAMFDDVSNGPGVEAFGLYHKALALAMVGDLEGADRLLGGGDETPIALTRRGYIARAQILGQLERGDEAVAMLDDVFGANVDRELQDLRNTLAAGRPVPFDIVTSAREGVAEVLYTISGVLNGEASDGYTLIYTRLTEFLREDHIEAILATASLLENLSQYKLANEAYDRVPRDHPSFTTAELGRADALRKSGRVDAAIEVLEQLSESYPDLPVVHITLGDTLRQLERYEDAAEVYDRAVALFKDPQESQWAVYFARGIAREREDRWPEAEADFRQALELRPDQPQVLNYLGYSYVEMQTNLTEALDLIERAVAARPDSGYITDSLGWVLYRLGRYEEAVAHMERAVELTPIDPIVNDHLGDVYWAVGREREAEFQWHRALSFDPTETDAARIRRKLEIGLDAVLEEEGAEPLAVANDDG